MPHLVRVNELWGWGMLQLARELIFPRVWVIDHPVRILLT